MQRDLAATSSYCAIALRVNVFDEKLMSPHPSRRIGVFKGVRQFTLTPSGSGTEFRQAGPSIPWDDPRRANQVP